MNFSCVQFSLCDFLMSVIMFRTSLKMGSSSMSTFCMQHTEEKENQKLRLSPQELKQALTEQYPCFVLITCSAPNAQGQLDVEMIYEGDAHLAAYMVETAQAFIEEERV